MYAIDLLIFNTFANRMTELKINPFYVLGAMSGTSLDGLDLALIEFNGNFKKLNFKIISATTLPYTTLWKNKLKNAIYASADEVQQIDQEYGQYLGTEIQQFLGQQKIKPQIIASHGHTIFHKPEKGYTLQIGNGPQIFNTTKIPTVCNFRVQDVALKGQGAPLVPIGDAMLFSNFMYCLNLGGFANVSTQENNNRVAFDICAVNIVLNDLAQKLGFDYDNEGKIAKSGAIDFTVLKQLNQLSFYKKLPPKSLGKEWVDLNIWPLLKNLSPTSAIATFTEHAAQQIGNTLHKKGEALVTGGGAFNKYLIERIQTYATSTLVIPNRELVDFKEALVFALLGLLRWHHKNNCLATVTGATKNHSSGIVYL